ncbi:ATP-binding protein [Stenotrophomonas humi]|uniref:ATP-binding protein n=1 Tax=Stenotrophomonas humi TaxID=405444 RepID=A0A0R0CIX8_9GAMM|nr:ATP-binding protein [Stenotrophomonas humi]
MALLLATGIAGAQVFGQPDNDFKGSVRATAPVVLPGGETGLEGSGFKPGQKVTLLRGDSVLNAQPYVADGEGKFTGKLAVPADAVPGQQPIVVRASGPDAASIFELKVSRDVPLSGQESIQAASNKLAQGLYQVAYSPKSKAAFVTSAVGRPPVKQSELLKVDPETLQVIARVSPQAAPGNDGNLFAVYGVGVDDANGNVWVTNTRQDTVAVYRQSDLALVKQFPVGAVSHSRDVVIDAQHNRAYVSATGADFISVFDTRTLQQLENITIASSKRGETFTPTSLDIDPATGRIYTVSLGVAEAAVIDGVSGKVEKVFPLAGARDAIGVAWNPLAKRLLVVSQGSDNLLIVDPESGKVEHDVYVGAGALNVSYSPSTRLAYVSNRAAGTVTVVDEVGSIVANLDGGTYPNHVSKGPDTVMFAVNKSRGADDAKGDRITRFVPKQ